MENEDIKVIAKYDLRAESELRTWARLENEPSPSIWMSARLCNPNFG